jgi:hypothetical protein
MYCPEERMDSLPVGPECLFLAQSAVSLALGQIKICANSHMTESEGNRLIIFIL